MGLFHNKEQYQGYNIYSVKKYIDRKKLIFTIIVGVITIIALILVIYYVIDTSIRVGNAKKFKEQIIEYQKQLEESEKLENKQEQSNQIAQAKIPNLTQVGKDNINNIYNSEIAKRVFITFDDGPSNNTSIILDILKEKNIKATFFVLGNQVEVFPETTKRIYEEGHYIANHGYSHKYSSIYTSPEEVLNEYNKCNDAVAKAIGINEYNSHLFRFPGGSVGGKYVDIKNKAKTILQENEILYLDWNALTGDSEKANPTEEYLMNNLQRTTNGKNSVVLLMHDSQSKKVTADFLPKVIEYLQQQGYEFKDFYEIIK